MIAPLPLYAPQSWVWGEAVAVVLAMFLTLGTVLLLASWVAEVAPRPPAVAAVVGEASLYPVHPISQLAFVEKIPE